MIKVLRKIKFKYKQVCFHIINETNLFSMLFYDNYILLKCRINNISMLQYIGITFGTDKSNLNQSFNGMTYLDIYHKNFQHLKYKKVKLLELGVQGGNSIRTWKRYFRKGLLVGLDFDKSCIQHIEKRVKIYIGDQKDLQLLNLIHKENGLFDIIIDDASHINELSITSFKFLFNKLKKGGSYVIEDLHCSYEDLNLVKDLWNNELIKNKENGVNLKNIREDINRFLLDLIKKLDQSTGDVMSVKFYNQMVIITRI